MQLDLFESAEKWHDSGCSVIPILANGTKRPAIEWKRNQAKRIHPSAYRRELAQGCGIGLICGEVSGNLELTEIEARATSAELLSRILDECTKRDVDSTWLFLNASLSILSPSGGLHLVYRIEDHEVPGNTKIARRPANADELAENPQDKVKVLAETRGEGGYFIAAPTGGTVHPTGQDWKLVAGQIGDIPTINWIERNALHEAIHAALDKMPQEAARERPRSVAPDQTRTGTRPGDDFNERADWHDILEPAGWTVHTYKSANEIWWTRPGKDRKEGHSATTGHSGRGADDRLYVMSSSSEFNTDEPMTKFYVYAHYNHNGNPTAAARELGRQGYGDQRPRTPKADPQAAFRAAGDWADSEPVKEAPVTSPFQLARARGVHDYTITGAAVQFGDKWGDYVRYVQEEKKWRIWDGIRWVHDKGGSKVCGAFEALTEDMYFEAQAMADDDPLRKPRQAYVKKLRNLAPSTVLAAIAAQVTCGAEEFDADTRYLNLRNGVYDTQDLTLLPHDPKYMATKVMGASYDPDATAPDAEKFLVDLLPDASMRDYVLRALGYTLTGEADQRAFFLLHGLPGTGKTQFLEMMQEVFGGYGVTAMASTFHKRPDTGGPNPDLHALRGARFITTSETSQDSRLDEESLKRFTGKDIVSTRSLYEAPQEWVPQGTVWFATNHLPKFASDEDAIWRRVKTVNFGTQFSDDGTIGQKGEPNIGRKLAAREADGIFTLLVQALAAYRADGYLKEPAELKRQVADHKHEVDPVAQFWDDMVATESVVEQAGTEVEFKLIYATYADWHRENVGPYPLGRRRFGDSLKATVGYKELRKSHGRSFIPGWHKQGWIVGMKE